MVIVQPCQFFVSEHFDEDGLFTDRAEGERFELEEFSEFRFHRRHDEQRIFDTHSVAIGFVDAGLVRQRHAGLKNGWHIVHSQLVGAFVNAKVRAHSVSCAVQVVDTVFAHREAGQEV